MDEMKNAPLNSTILLEFIVELGCIFFYSFQTCFVNNVYNPVYPVNFLLFSYMLSMPLNSFYNISTEHAILQLVIILQQ